MGGHMRKTLWALAAIAVGGLVGWMLAGDGGWRAAVAAVRAVTAGPGTGAPAPLGVQGGHDASAKRAVATLAAPGSAPTASPVAAVALTGRRIAELGMTRQLAGEHRIELEGRPYRVLGSKEVSDPSGKVETLLLIHDDLSGQVRYFVSGLQFTLVPGTDAEAFIREHPRQRRVFVNPVYAQVAVDAAEIATEYNRLRTDARVASVRFMTREPVRTWR